MQFTIDLDKILLANLDLLNTLIFAASFGICMLLICFLFRLLLGKNSSLNHAVSSALGIMLIYAVTAVVYTFNPRNLSQYLSPLPFVQFLEDKLVLFSFRTAQLPAICHQILSMIVLAFLVNLINNYIPEKTRVLGWFIYRLLSMLGAMILHYVVHQLIAIFIPGILEGYAPMILLCILIFMLFLGILKFIMGLLLTAVNPVFGAIYAFFFSNKIGKQLSKAVFSTLVISAVFVTLEILGYSVIPISPSALNSYIPFAVCMCILWFVIGRVL